MSYNLNIHVLIITNIIILQLCINYIQLSIPNQLATLASYNNEDGITSQC